MSAVPESAGPVRKKNGEEERTKRKRVAREDPESSQTAKRARKKKKQEEQPEPESSSTGIRLRLGHYTPEEDEKLLSLIMHAAAAKGRDLLEIGSNELDWPGFVQETSRPRNSLWDHWMTFQKPVLVKYLGGENYADNSHLQIRLLKTLQRDGVEKWDDIDFSRLMQADFFPNETRRSLTYLLSKAFRHCPKETSFKEKISMGLERIRTNIANRRDPKFASRERLVLNYNEVKRRLESELAAKAEEQRLREVKTVEGSELYNAGDFKEALQCYNEAIAKLPPMSALYCHRAACHIKLQQFTEAKEDAERSVQLDPTNLQALILLTQSTVPLGDVAAAEEAVDKAAALDPENADIQVQKAKIESLDTFVKKALDALDRKVYKEYLLFLKKAQSIATASSELALLRADCLGKLRAQRNKKGKERHDEFLSKDDSHDVILRNENIPNKKLSRSHDEISSKDSHDKVLSKENEKSHDENWNENGKKSHGKISSKKSKKSNDELLSVQNIKKSKNEILSKKSKKSNGGIKSNEREYLKQKEKDEPKEQKKH